MKKDNVKEKLEIHYYLTDGSHSMNAFVRNKAEKDLLDSLRKIGELLDNELDIETETYQEGGLVEWLAIGVPVLHYLSPSINNIITHYFTKNADLEELDKKIKEETLTNLQLDNISKIKDIERDIDNKLDNKLVQKYVSNFYKRINDYKKVEKIGFKDIENNSEELIVYRQYFKNFILEDNVTLEEDDDAMIEIISPVLKEGKYNWRGKYKGDKVDFSMGDTKFKQEVIEGKHTFLNGSLISCHLQIKTTFDEFGDEKRKSYSVQKVYGTQELELGELKLRESGKKKKQDKWFNEHCPSLFDEKSNNE
ncbi:hypothetical protein [Arcobacter roscoffensis]|uniref:Uncharacterized protein n=1 Tax=Arcobacter roscoffensis TaxID=2961520 RepID=A0ABY5E4M6_9BACT|nr:hypothetical protein [Arcobacter roscoffensis]UTJ07112.1 hypothetical protein NJU99_03160 [Arcobacter roscoffensis]